MDEKKLRTETSIPHSKIGKLPRIQISQWLEDVFLPFCAEWMIPMKKCHKFCFRCSAAMFRSDVRYISISSAQFRYPVMLFPLYQITEAHLASRNSRLTFFSLFFCIRHPMVSGACWLLCVPGVLETRVTAEIFQLTVAPLPWTYSPKDDALEKVIFRLYRCWYWDMIHFWMYSFQ